MHFVNQKFLVLMLWLTGAITPLSAEIQQPVVPVSTIEIPVRLSLEPLIEMAERAVPRQTGIWTGWKNWHGIKSQYRAWRGPLGISVSGNVLTVQAHIRYWIKARKKVLGALKLKGSCGIDEAPRQAVIGMQVRLGWGQDWALRPEFFIMPTRFLDRCKMTIANIDVTPLVEREFRKQMQSSLRDALIKFAPSMNAIQQHAQRTWFLMQQPVALGQDNWLMLRPTGVALSPIVGQGKYIDTQLNVTFQPKLVTGTKPVGEQNPLPSLGYYYPRTTGLNLHLDMTLDFVAISQRLADSLVGKSFVIKGQKVGINSFNLAGSGQELSARIELIGEFTGVLELRGHLAFDGHEQKLVLQDLMFDFDANDAATGLFTGAFHEPIRLLLESTANQALSQYLDWLRGRVSRVLDRVTPANVKVDLSLLRLGNLQIHLVQQGIRLDGNVTGRAQLVLP